MKKFLITAVFSCVLVLGLKAQLVVDNTITVNDLVNEHLVGENVDIFNILINGVPGDQAYTNAGLFNSTNSNIPIEDGIVLASGNCINTVGPNDGDGTSMPGDLPAYNDADLDSIATGSTNDETVLEFDFIPQGEVVVFRYVFSSEEYNDFTCASVNDAFGFFISGPGIDGEFTNDGINIAIIPGTDLPVSINTVNNGVPAGTNCTEEGLANTEFFIDNEGNTDPNSTQMDGFTVILEATANVECGEMYHLKMAICDVGDSVWDSAVFLESGSFGAIPIVEIDIETPTDSSLVGEGCQIDFKFTRLLDAEADTVQLIVEGTAENGVDFDELPEYLIFEAGQSEYTLPITGIYDGIEEGVEDITMKMRFFSCGDTLEFSATAFIEDAFPLEVNVGSDVYCKEFDGYATIMGEATGGYGELTYYWTQDSIGGIPSDTLDPTNPMPIDDPLFVAYHWLTVNDECILTESSSVPFILENNCPILAPNVFTPNGDGLNDTFEVVNIFLFPNSKLTVYNRWGQEVYSDNNYANNWDGDGVPDGTYFWVISLSEYSEQSVVNGYVTITR